MHRVDRVGMDGQWGETAGQVHPRLPGPATRTDDTEVDVFAYMRFPAQHRARLHSTKAAVS